MGELVFNQIVPTTKQQLLQIIADLQEKEKIEGVILGGTELPLILQQADFKDLRVFDSGVIHIDAILDKMMS